MTDTQRAAFEAEMRAEFALWHKERYGWYTNEGVDRKIIDDRLESFMAGRQAAQAADAGREEQPSITNHLTPYGLLVRALRIVAGTTLYDMAKALLTTPAKLSSMEFGRAEVTPEFAFDIAAYFDALGIPDTQQAISAALTRAKEQKS
jgi:hypothetical protein